MGILSKHLQFFLALKTRLLLNMCDFAYNVDSLICY